MFRRCIIRSLHFQQRQKPTSAIILGRQTQLRRSLHRQIPGGVVVSQQLILQRPFGSAGGSDSDKSLTIMDDALSAEELRSIEEEALAAETQLKETTTPEGEDDDKTEWHRWALRKKKEQREAKEWERERYDYNSQSLNDLNFNVYPYYIERAWWKEGKRTNFWANWHQLADIRRRRELAQWGAHWMRYEALITNHILPRAIRDEFKEEMAKLPKGANPRRIRSLCQFTGRQRGKFNRFRVNRHIFRRMADAGQLSGVQRSMW